MFKGNWLTGDRIEGQWANPCIRYLVLIKRAICGFQKLHLVWISFYSWPLNSVVFGVPNPLCSQKSAYNFLLPKTLATVDWKPYWQNNQLIDTYFIRYMYYIFYSYNKVIWGKENVIKIVRKRIYIYSIYWINYAYK